MYGKLVALRNKRKGFTLIELLIVIVIIATLTTIMMLASGAGTSQAKATAVVSDIRGLKSAALMYYGKHMQTSGAKFKTAIQAANSTYTLLGPFVANPEDLNATGGTSSGASTDGKTWCFTCDNNGRNWYVGMKVDNLDNDVLEYLGEMARSSGLVGAADCTAPTSPTPWTFVENYNGFLLMKVR